MYISLDTGVLPAGGDKTPPAKNMVRCRRLSLRTSPELFVSPALAFMPPASKAGAGNWIISTGCMNRAFPLSDVSEEGFVHRCHGKTN